MSIGKKRGWTEGERERRGEAVNEGRKKQTRERERGGGRRKK